MTAYHPLSTSESSPPPVYTEEDLIPRIVPASSRIILKCFCKQTIRSATSTKMGLLGRCRTRVLAYRASLIILSMIILSLTLSSIYLFLVLLVLQHLDPIVPENGLQQVLKSWRQPDDSSTLLRDFSYNLTDDIMPKPCHAHDDYSHHVPLFQALSVGCTSVEADLWIPSEEFLAAHPEASNDDLLVGYTRASLRPERTLRSLYIDPLAEILFSQNSGPNPAPAPASTEVSNDSRNGIFSTSPNQTFVLLLDIKENPAEIFKRIQVHLDTLREAPYLTYWNETFKQRIDRSLTIVLTGEADFDEVTDQSKNYFHDVFYDAPLHNLSSREDHMSPYNESNSYFASANLAQHIGKLGLGSGRFTLRQMKEITAQITEAKKLGLVSRYWGTPSWPVSMRHYVWRTLLDLKVGVLNVDDIGVAARWDWSNSLLSYCDLLRGFGFKNTCR